MIGRRGSKAPRIPDLVSKRCVQMITLWIPMLYVREENLSMTTAAFAARGAPLKTRLSVCLYGWNNSGTDERILTKFGIGELNEKFWRLSNFYSYRIVLTSTLRDSTWLAFSVYLCMTADIYRGNNGYLWGGGEDNLSRWCSHQSRRLTLLKVTGHNLHCWNVIFWRKR